MNLWWRLLYTMIFSRFRSPCGVMEVCRTPFRCWPTDLDALFHMNNGKYLSIMDIARTDFVIRSGLLKKLNQYGYYPVVEGQTIRYRKSLSPFDPFVIDTKVLGWDERAIFLSQKFIRTEEVIAEAIVKARFLKRPQGFVSPQEINALVGWTEASPALDEAIHSWNQNLQIKRGHEIGI